MNASANPNISLDWQAGDVDALRATYAREREAFNADLPADVGVTELAALGAEGLLFTPADILHAVPILYFHGGGWMVGSPSTHRALCAVLARETGRQVLSVKYRLAPEHPFPAQKVDAVTAVNAALSGRINALRRPQSLMLAGDSAGAAVALWAEAGLLPSTAARIERIISFYGAFGLRESDSMRRLGDSADTLSAADVAAMYARLGPALPERMFDSFRGTGAPLTLLVSGRDSLADDSRRLAQWATAQGRDVTLVEAEGMPHGFMHGAVRSDEALSWMRRTVRPGPLSAGNGP
ncbi:alpha/beta hydrolase fold domain-containing protein [Brevirhabdus sp.]|uniref:alpha/beta hydrolase fold domain-containing protein n=1 Tax=Brevirhabdus sp. TaxID=2004514 RepID=UPI004057E3A8